MAVTSYSPIPVSIPDAVTFKEAAALFQETGHPASANTLVRLARAKGYKTERVGRTDYISYSDLLEAHAEWVRSQDAD
ncbi:hypothetical protein [Streptomyces sp. NPDC060001]|uniref:hypothetical protein n=1 Tax=Streptomyces sp. NPDC060001 TaxID=3347032 RepID=UPI00367A1997